MAVKEFSELALEYVNRDIALTSRYVALQLDLHLAPVFCSFSAA